jgi:hypothetical protein
MKIVMKAVVRFETPAGDVLKEVEDHVATSHCNDPLMTASKSLRFASHLDFFCDEAKTVATVLLEALSQKRIPLPVTEEERHAA